MQRKRDFCHNLNWHILLNIFILTRTNKMQLNRSVNRYNSSHTKKGQFMSSSFSVQMLEIYWLSQLHLNPSFTGCKTGALTRQHYGCHGKVVGFFCALQSMVRSQLITNFRMIQIFKILQLKCTAYNGQNFGCYKVLVGKGS